MEDVRPLVHEASEHQVVEDGLSAEYSEVLESPSDPHPGDLMWSIVQQFGCFAGFLAELN